MNPGAEKQDQGPLAQEADFLQFPELIEHLEMSKRLPPVADGPVSSGPCSLITDSFDGTAVARWHQIIADYSSLRLSLAKDRLPAIAGLARKELPIRRTRYLAGLWEDSLVLDMAWQSLTIPSRFPSRPSEYVAPTWSWASVKCGVKYLGTETLWPCPSETHVEILGAACTPLDAMFSTGQVKNGCIVLRGRLEEVYVQNVNEVRDGADQAIPGSLQGDYDFTSSGPSYIEPGSVAYRLPILTVHTSSSREDSLLLSLILRCLSLRAQVYERVGILRQDKKNDLRPWLRDGIGFPVVGEGGTYRRSTTIALV